MKESKNMEEKRKITVSEVLSLLDEGKTRKEIEKYFGLNPREAKELWKHPKLINKKPAKYSVGIVIVDDNSNNEDLRDDSIIM